MLPTPTKPVVATHWGTYLADTAGALAPHPRDPDPSPIGRGMVAARTDAARVRKPAVRASWLTHGPRRDAGGRGSDPFVEVEWDVALDLVAAELARVRAAHGPEGIYGGSYGWSSAGRFHHAQSQIHRFLNAAGGYTASILNYSYAAGGAVVPHIIGDASGLEANHTPWSRINAHADFVVMFGGVPAKNAQVNSGGISRHHLRSDLAGLAARQVPVLSISPVADDIAYDGPLTRLMPRPGTDTALILGLAHVLLSEGLHDRAFLDRYCTGFDTVAAYLTGAADGTVRDADWAAAICGLEAGTIRELARRMAQGRTFLMMAWALQRAENGEQPFWALITLAAMLGQIGQPGGGFGFGYGAVDGTGRSAPVRWPSLSQLEKRADSAIPVARIADMLLHPGAAYDYNGRPGVYPDIRLIYWAGGNPFHHHQDLNRLLQAWQRPETIVVHEAWWTPLARHADIVLPTTVQMERDDIACSARDTILQPSHRVFAPYAAARDDYTAFAGIAERLGVGQVFTEGRDAEGWLRALYALGQQRLAAEDIPLPDFDSFWQGEGVEVPEKPLPDLLAGFVADPEGAPLATPSGKIELFSSRVAGFGYEGVPGHAAWVEPVEWLGRAGAEGQFHLISNQPRTRLHSQYDNGAEALESKVAGREPMRMHPEDAADHGLSDGDVALLWNNRGACLAGVVTCAGIRRGVLQLSTGAWYDPVELMTPEGPRAGCAHGNPNVLTRDVGTSALGQGPVAQSCLVHLARWTDALPPVRAFGQPLFVTND